MDKKRLSVLIMGLTLPFWGWLANGILSGLFTRGILHLLSAAVLAIWALMAFFAEDILDNTARALFYLNLPLLIVLLLYSVNVLLGFFFPSGLQKCMELFFLPMAKEFQTDSWTSYALPLPLPQVIAAVLLLSASFSGRKVRRYERPERGF